MMKVTLIYEFSALVSQKVARDRVLLSMLDSPSIEDTFELLSEFDDTSDVITAGTMIP